MVGVSNVCLCVCGVSVLDCGLSALLPIEI